MKSANIIAILLLVIGLGAGFFGGMKYQQSQVANSSQGQAYRARTGAFPRSSGQGNQVGRGAVVGQILSQDSNSITVKLTDGSSKIVLLSSSTAVSKTDAGSKSDLKTGVNVAVFGTTNSDGSVTAQSVQLNPAFRTGGQGAGTPSGAPR